MVRNGTKANMNCAVWRGRLLAMARLTTAFSFGCGSSEGETPTTPSAFPILILNNWRVMTSGAFAGLGLNYVFCGSITPSDPIATYGLIRLVSREVTVYGADGQAYFTWVDRIVAESPRDIQGGTSGCFGNMSDPVVGRPVASTFVGKIGYSSGGRTGVAEVSGPVVRIP